MKKDMGDMTSRDIGNLVAKGLVDLGKESLPDNIDYGDLPSGALPELGKQLLAGKKK